MLEQIHCEYPTCVPITVAPRRTGMTIPCLKALRPTLLKEISASFLKKSASLCFECWKLLVGNVAVKMCSLVSTGKGESWDCRSETASLNNQRHIVHDYNRQEHQLGNQTDLSEISDHAYLSIACPLKSYLICTVKIP